MNLLVIEDDPEMAEFVQRVLSEAGATTLRSAAGPLTVVRALGPDGTRVRATLEAARHRIRDAWGRPRIDPGIWRS